MSNIDKFSEIQAKYRKMDKLIEFFKNSGLSVEDLERAVQDIKAVYAADKVRKTNEIY